MKKYILTLAMLLLAAGFVPSAFSQELLVNGGFENGTFSGWTHVDASNIDYIGSDPAFVHDGTYYANLGTFAPNTGSLSQTFTTLVGQTYTVSFWLAHDVTGTPSNSFTASFNGTPLLSLNNIGAQNYTFYSFTVSPTATSSTLSFSYQDNDDFFRLDTVSVVPEPATWSMLVLGGVASVGATYLRRRRV